MNTAIDPAIHASIAFQSPPDLFGHDASDLPLPADLPREARRLQETLGLTSKEMGERFGISRPSWDNVKRGAQWTEGLKGHRIEVWRKLQAEAMARKDQDGGIEVAPVVECGSDETAEPTPVIDQGEVEPESTPDADPLAQLPVAMLKAQRWLVWKSIPHVDPAKKPRKVPFYCDGSPRTGTLDTPEDRARLATLDKARATLATGAYAGLGFALGPDDEGNHWQGIDLDGTDTRPELAALVSRLPGYVERSPSGTGWHALGIGRDFATLGSNATGIEAYSHGRYFTVTAKEGRGDLEDIADFVTHILAPLHSPRPTTSATDTPTPNAGEGFFAKVNAKALASLSAWVPVVFPKARPYHDGFRVSSQDLGRNLEEDISIVPQGIRDFGEESGKTPIDLVVEWGSARDAKDAAHWLCKQMGIDPAALGWRDKTPLHTGAVAFAERKRQEWGAANQDGDTAPTDHTEQPDDTAKLNEPEAEQLVAWSWRTGTALPAAREQFEGAINPKTGKPDERLRVNVQAGTNFAAPWLKIAWESGRDDFLSRVEAYLPRREARVEAENARRMEEGQPPAADIDSAYLRQHARDWQARIQALSVSDETARELLARITPPWPEPQPIPATLRPVAPFDMGLLPLSLRGWVEDVTDRMQCPPDFPAVGAMVALSSVIGRKAAIHPRVYDDWALSPNLWGCVVGRPGIMKSPALSAALAPLERLQAKANRDHQDAKKEHTRNEKLRAMQGKADEAKAQKLIAQGKRKDAEDLLIEAEYDAENADPPPVLRRYKVTDASVEALGEILMENPWGTLAYRDELHGLLASMDKEGQEGARAFYLQSYDAKESYTFDRIVRGRNLHIPAPCLSMLGGIQPGKLKSYVRAATEGGTGDDGLLQRFSLIVWPDVAREWRDVDRWPDTEAKNRAFAVFERLDALEPTIDPDTGEPVPAVYRFSPTAQEVFKEWRANLEARLREGNLHPALESHLSKYRKLVPAVALVCALADEEAEVSEASLLRALAWAEYLESHAERVYAAGTVMDLDGAVALLAKIRAGAVKDGFKPADVYLKGWSNLATPKDVGAAARILCDLGHLRRDETPPGPGGGRPSVTYQINPATLTER